MQKHELRSGSKIWARPPVSPEDEAELRNAVARFCDEVETLFHKSAMMRANNYAGDSACLPNLLSLVAAAEPVTKALLGIRNLKASQQVYYDREDQEYLSHTSPDEATEHILEEYLNPEDWPEVVEVVVYRKKPVDRRYVHVLENLLENLDEDYMGEEPTKATDSMKAAEERFLDQILLEYEPYWCYAEDVLRLPLREWLRKYADPETKKIAPPVSFRKQICPHCYQPRGENGFATCARCGRRACFGCRLNESRYSYPYRHFTCRYASPETLAEEKLAESRR